MIGRRWLLAGATTVVLAGAVGGAALAWGAMAGKPAAAPRLPPATTKVARATLVETRTVSGTLGYGDSTPVAAAEAGTLTWTAPVGSIVKRGEPLFKVDERPVVALYGPVPMYRTLRSGERGADVQQLERNLADLGYTGFTVDETYTSSTALAVGAWQVALGLPDTGTVDMGQVVFVPGAVRVAEHAARVGDVLGGGSSERAGSVLSYTGTTRLATVDLAVSDQALAVAGRTVTVTVPGQKAVAGTIAQVGTVATAPAQASPAPAGGSAVSAARIEVTVTIADQAALGSLDASPVDVDLVSQERRDVLAVPVAALLARPEGGYGLQVVNGTTTRVVPVQTGMFAGGRVEVSGQGIAEGVTVGVPR